MVSEIKPALTADEWATPDGWFVNPDRWIWLDCAGGCGVEDRHAMAAVCLHGQPFGFTREDVEVLEGLIVALERVGQLPSEPGLSEFYVPYCRSLADRIEALLPPEEWEGKGHG